MRGSSTRIHTPRDIAPITFTGERMKTKERTGRKQGKHSSRANVPKEDRGGISPKHTTASIRPESSIRADIAAIFNDHAERTPDVPTAAANAIAEIRAKNLPLELVTTLVQDYAQIRINRSRGVMRTSLRAASIGDEKRIASVAAGGWAWLTHYTVGSKTLGDCDAEDLIASAARKRDMAKGMSQAAQFEETVAKRIGNKLVREVLTDAAIEKINKTVQS